MRKFAALLDFRKVKIQETPSEDTKIGIVAVKLFPELVAESRFALWKPGDEIQPVAARFLVGVAASFSVANLRFLDVVNELLLGRPHADVVVDVFMLESLGVEKDLANYFPGFNVPGLGWKMYPILGEWKFGKYETTIIGGEAMDHVLSKLGSVLSAKDIHDSVCPPDPSIFE